MSKWARSTWTRTAGRGGSEAEGRFFLPALCGPSLQQRKSGCNKTWWGGHVSKSSMAGGGRYWDFLHQSVSFLLVAFRYCMNTWPQHWDQRRRQSVWNMTARKLFHLLVRGKMFRWGTHLLSLQMSPNRVYLFFFRDVRVSIYTSRCF